MTKNSNKLPFKHIQSDFKKWRINALVNEREEFLSSVVSRVIEKFRSEYPDAKSLYNELASTLYQERIRVSTSKWKSDPVDEKDFWNKIKSSLIKVQKNQEWTEEVRKELENILRRIVQRYSYEIVGGFNPKMFKIVQRILPKVLYFFLNFKSISILNFFKKDRFNYYKKFKILGNLEKIRNLSQKGTIIVVPTHFSNTDSPIVGWALNSLGLEASIYGAGINLFGTQPLSYLMENLGAYKLDRRKKNKIYLDTLLVYSQIAIERDTPSIFFPGGTRSRSGSIETKLKLGLLNTAIEAQQENLMKGGKKIFVLPMVINYQYNVEATSLINQYLRRIGKEKYVSENREYSTTYKIIRFVKQMIGIDTQMVVSFGHPMDVIGNRVDDDGNSISDQGKELDIKGFFSIEDTIVKDSQRNFQYTKILGDKIIESYYRYNCVMTVPLVARAYFNCLSKIHHQLDIYDLILLPREDRSVDRKMMMNELSRLVEKLKMFENTQEVLLSKKVAGRKIEKILYDGIKNINTFNSKDIIYIDSERNLNSEDIKLVYFYQNRLEGYKL